MSVSVEHAQLLINSPGTISEAVVGVTKADLQPAPQTIATPRNVAVNEAIFDVDGSVVALQWQQAGWVISVDAALITIAPQLLDGRRGIPVLTAIPTISGSDILFQLSSGNWTVPVDVGLPTILGQDIVLEKNQFFVRGEPILTPSTIVLSENAVVVTAAPTIAGQDVTLTWTQGAALVIPAQFSIVGQDVGLNKSWSLAVDSAALSFVGQNVIFDWVVPNRVVVDSAQLSVTPANFILARAIPISSTAISIAAQNIERSWGTVVSPAFLNMNGSDLSLLFQYVLGVAIDKADPTILGNDITLFLGDGRPRKAKVRQLSPAAHVAQKSRSAIIRHLSEH